MNKKLKYKNICFDLDNVICNTEKNFYSKAKPIKKNIKFINRLFSQGYNIKIFTDRFMGRSNENAKLAKQKALKITTQQLKKWKVRYHYIIFGKPSFDIIIDDKSLNFKKNWTKDLEKKLKQ